MQVASGCLLTDSAGNVLLVKPTYKPPWEVPGGVVEQAESPLAARRREIRKELAWTSGRPGCWWCTTASRNRVSGETRCALPLTVAS
jgi:ADP-ribose pyrophosphatase YjhB (NUDIX family)